MLNSHQEISQPQIYTFKYVSHKHTGFFDIQNLSNFSNNWLRQFSIYTILTNDQYKIPYILPSIYHEIHPASLLDPRKNFRGCCCCQLSKQSVKPDISPLVLQLGGQIGCQKKRNSSLNFIFQISCATFQLKLKKLQKTAPNRHISA